jgi:hypothetical protein
MQKKKPSFQVIPDYSVSGLTNWNESKEVPAEQGRNDTGPATSPTAAGRSVRLMAIADLSQRYRDLGLIFSILTRKWCGATAGYWRDPGRDTAACSLNIQAKYETLCAGRRYSLS